MQTNNLCKNNKLQEFLYNHTITGGDKNYTHTSIHPPKKFFISDEDLPEFYEIYTEVINTLSLEHLPKLTERAKNVSPIRIDFDFRWKQDNNDPIKRRYTKDMILLFCKEYIKIITKWLSITDDERVIFITEKHFFMLFIF